MGKLGLCMLSHSFSYLQLEQTLHALWVINNTKMGQSHPYKYNYIHIIQLSTNWSLDCIFLNNIVSQLEKQKRLELQVNNWVRWLISTVASFLWKWIQVSVLCQLDIIPSGLRSVCSVTFNPLKDFGSREEMPNMVLLLFG